MFELSVYINIFSDIQVIIEGFKSYKDQTAAEPFSSKINVVGELFFRKIPLFEIQIQLDHFSGLTQLFLVSLQSVRMDPVNQTSSRPSGSFSTML